MDHCSYRVVELLSFYLGLMTETQNLLATQRIIAGLSYCVIGSSNSITLSKPFVSGPVQSIEHIGEDLKYNLSDDDPDTGTGGS